MKRNCLINGPSKPLRGQFSVPAAKNCSMPILVASALIENGDVTIKNLPKISDINYLIKILETFDISIQKFEDKIRVVNNNKAKNFTDEISSSLSSNLRGSIYTLAIPLIRFGQAKIGIVGGDKIQGRNWNPHLRVFSGFGIEFFENAGGWELKGFPKKNREFSIDDNGITATSLAIIIAASIEGRTVIHNASKEIENDDLIRIVQSFGVHIYRENNTIIVNGPMLPGKYFVEVPPDQVVWGTFAIAGLLTNGEIVTKYSLLDDLMLRCRPILNMFREAGANIIRKSPNELMIRGDLTNPFTVETGVYPAFPSDLVPQTMVLMSRIPGVSNVIENLYLERFSHSKDLKKMGVEIDITSNKAFVRGTDKDLIGVELIGGGIRESCAMMLAGLVAKGKTKIINARAVDRGYEDIVGSLLSLGAA